MVASGGSTERHSREGFLWAGTANTDIIATALYNFRQRGPVWTPIASNDLLVPQFTARSGEVGSSVAIDGDTPVVATGGAAYVFGPMLPPVIWTNPQGGDWHTALPAAAAVELLHNFSLIHDDIEDTDPLRRGRPTLWQVWGTAQAINAGDALFSLAHTALHRLSDGRLPAERRSWLRAGVSIGPASC